VIDCSVEPDEFGYVSGLYDPAHRKWIGVGFCQKCGGYHCTTSYGMDREELERSIRYHEDKIVELRARLGEDS
jgi:hypothetical protein